MTKTEIALKNSFLYANELTRRVIRWKNLYREAVKRIALLETELAAMQQGAMSKPPYFYNGGRRYRR